MNSQTLEFYKGKKVLVTGHTGFKGSWLTKILVDAGAEVTGYSRCSEKPVSLYELSEVGGSVNTVAGDICDYDRLLEAFKQSKPEIVIHMAAQPIVRESYRDPAYTYRTNVMGTVNVLECVRNTSTVKSLLNVTTDKVYRNNEWPWGYRENEFLDGLDPYSNSKSCSEIITHSYNSSFLQEAGVAVSTARAGNVIGGGDFSPDRLIPDCVRAAISGETMLIRNPDSTRPFQHVLEPLFAYLMIAAKQYEDAQYSGWYNVGPDDCDCVNTEKLVSMFAEKWGDEFSYKIKREKDAPHEANFLKLDCSKLKSTFGWQPRWRIEEAVAKTVEWTAVWQTGGDVPAEMAREIRAWLSKA